MVEQLSPDNVSTLASEAAEFIGARFGTTAGAAVVLGSGWDALAEGLDPGGMIDFESLVGFKKPIAHGHAGKVGLLETGASPLIIQLGRLHCYEGCTPLEVSFPVWVYKGLGVRLLVMLSAAGGLNPDYQPGDLMVVRDQVFLMGESPLLGFPPVPERSPHVSGQGMYPSKWQDALKAALPGGARCHRGVYFYVNGPTLETAAEAAMLRAAGGDAVGMSTAPEAMTARYLGMDVAAMCCISNTHIPPPDDPPTHAGVLETVRGVAGGLRGFLETFAGAAGM